MELPEKEQRQILSYLRDARDIAACASVCRSWRIAVPDLRALHFHYKHFKNNKFLPLDTLVADTGRVMTRMIEAAHQLEELVLHCEFTAASLQSWLQIRGHGLRRLEIRFAKLADEAALMAACPNLIHMVLLLDGASTVTVGLEKLKTCHISLNKGNRLSIKCSNLEELEIEGFNSIKIEPNDTLRLLSISHLTGIVYKIDVPQLQQVESIVLRDLRLSHTAYSDLLRSTPNLTKFNVRFYFDLSEQLLEMNILEFFSSHRKLQVLQIEGGLFSAFCKSPLQPKVTPVKETNLKSFVVQVDTTQNADQKICVLNWILVVSPRLKTMKILWTHSTRVNFEICMKMLKFAEDNSEKVRLTSENLTLKRVINAGSIVSEIKSICWRPED